MGRKREKKRKRKRVGKISGLYDIRYIEDIINVDQNNKKYKIFKEWTDHSPIILA